MRQMKATTEVILLLSGAPPNKMNKMRGGKKEISPDSQKYEPAVKQTTNSGKKRTQLLSG